MKKFLNLHILEDTSVEVEVLYEPADPSVGINYINITDVRILSVNDSTNSLIVDFANQLLAFSSDEFSRLIKNCTEYLEDEHALRNS